MKIGMTFDWDSVSIMVRSRRFTDNLPKDSINLFEIPKPSGFEFALSVPF
jgi:hypothetical protein